MMSREYHKANFSRNIEKLESSQQRKTSMDSSLGILDLDNLSALTENRTIFQDRLSLISEKTKQNSDRLCQSQSHPLISEKTKQNDELLWQSQSRPVFKIPDISTTNALLSKRMFPQTFQSSFSTQQSISDDIPVKEIPSSVSQESLDSKYFRDCSDSEWRLTRTMDETKSNSTQSFFDSNKPESRISFENIFSKTGLKEQKSSIVTDDLPTPFKGNQSIIGMNKSTNSGEICDSLEFRHDQISARSSSLNGSTTISGSSSNSNPTNTFTSKFGSVLTESSTHPFGANTLVRKNPFDSFELGGRSNKSWMPPDNVRLSFPNSFQNEFQAVKLDDEHFLSGGDAMKIIAEGEEEFLKERELELPDDLPLGSEAPSFGTYRNTSTISRPSFVNSTLTNGEVPDRVTKDILFRAKSDPLGALGRNSKTLRPYFGIDVKSPARNDITNLSMVSQYKNENSKDHSKYISELVNDLSITIPENELLPRDSVNKRKGNANLSKISEGFDSPTLPSCDSSVGVKVNRCHSANEVDFSSRNSDIRKCNSTGDLSPTKKINPLIFSDNYASYHSLPNNSNVFSQNGGQSFGFCPSHQPQSVLQINPHFNGPQTCLQCYDGATRMNHFPPAQIHYPLSSPLASYPYQVPVTPNFYYPEQNTQQNEIIRGPSELSAGSICWGSKAKVNIPLINPSFRVLSCSFTMITVFMGSQKVKPEKLGINLPGIFDIPPRGTKESTISVTAVEEGVFNFWIEITTTVPCLQTSLGSFMCHVTLTVEYPKLIIETPTGKRDKLIDFQVVLAQDKDINDTFIKITSLSKAVTPIIVFLQTKNSEDFQFTFSEAKINKIMMGLSHSYQILSSTISLFQIKGETSNSDAVLIPITVTKRNKTLAKCGVPCILEGSITVGLQCPNKEDEDLEKILLRAQIRYSRSLSSSDLYNTTETAGARHISKRSTSQMMKSTSMKSLDFDTTTNKNNDTFNNCREIAERDETISKLDSTSFMDSKWNIEPTKLHFINHDQELEFFISSSILLWMQIRYPKDVLVVSPDQGICHPNSKVLVKVKLLTKMKQHCVEEIKITGDGLEKVLKVILKDLPDISPLY